MAEQPTTTPNPATPTTRANVAKPSPPNAPARRASSSAANRAAAIEALKAADAQARAAKAPADPHADVKVADVVASGPAPGESGKPADAEAKAAAETPSLEQARKEAKRERASLQDRLRREQEEWARKQEERRALDEIRKQQEELKAKWSAVERAEKDPLGYLADKGMTADKLVEMGLKAGDPVAQMARELEALKKWRAEDEAARQRAAQAAEQQRIQQAVMTVKADFAKMVDTDPDRYPTLAGYPDEWIGERCYRIAEQYFNESGGKIPDKADVLNYLETVAKKEHDTRIARRTKKPAAEAEAKAQSVEPAQQMAQSARPAKPSPRTITNGHTPRASARTAKKTTREERRRNAMALLGR